MRTNCGSTPAGLVLCLLALAAAGSTHAATICVKTGSQLQAAFDTAESNAQADTIRIEVGDLTSSLGFVYAAFSEDFDLTLSGGWSPSCGFQQSKDPLATQLLRSTNGTILSMTLSNGTVRLENLSFYEGVSPSGVNVRIRSDFGASAINLSLDRLGFFFGISGQTLRISGSGFDEIRLRNSIFFENFLGSSSMAYIDPGNFQSATNVYLINNTVIGNFGSGNIGGIQLDDDEFTQALIVNNIFWDNSGDDLRFKGDGNIILRNNNIENLSGVPDMSFNPLSVDPQMGLYTPNFDSPMVDAGAKPRSITQIPKPFEDDWALGLVDFNGDDRVQGARVDIGAAEAFPEIIFKNGYEQ